MNYLESLVVDLEADLAQFDETEAWMRRSEAAAATVLALYEGSAPTDNVADLVAAVETAGWQSWPSIARNTIDDLRSTGNYRLIRDPALRRAISSYYATIENVSIPNANMRDRMWAQYDARVVNVLAPGVRLGVLQRPESFGHGITSDALAAADPPSVEELIAALRAFPELKIAASEVLYQTIGSRAGLEEMRSAALELKDTLERWLASGVWPRPPRQVVSTGRSLVMAVSPPNNAMKLTVKSGGRPGKKSVRRAPLFPAPYC